MDVRRFENIFSALSSPLRLQMVLLMSKRPFCVCELENIFDVTQPAISQNIKILKSVNLLNEKKNKQWVFYSTNVEFLKSVLNDYSKLLESESTFVEIAGLRFQDLPHDPQEACKVLEEKRISFSKRNTREND